MDLLQRIVFNSWYYFKPPWDSGISPPELEEFIRTHPPGNALDLGCGTGTNLITLARNGWRVTGIDFAPRAIQITRRKLLAAGLSAQLHTGDVIELKGITGPFDLALDLGCFHGLSDRKKAEYFIRLDQVLRAHGCWLMYGIVKPNSKHSGPGFLNTDLINIPDCWTCIHFREGIDKRSRKSAWLLYQKHPG